MSENARAITILVPETPGLNPLVYVDLVVPVTKNPDSKDVEVVFEHVQVIHANLDFIVAAEKGFKFITLLLTAEQAKVFAKLPHTTRSKFRARLSTAK